MKPGEGVLPSLRLLSHARPTSHGTYLSGINEDLEDLEDYQEGGYHSVHLGDCLGTDGRYKVIHKLGHGGFGTVWLCRDSKDNKYVAVKVMTSDVPAVDLKDVSLMKLDLFAAGSENISVPLDHFSLEGPNDTHQCIVLTLLGPPVSPRFWERIQNPGTILRKMCLQATQAFSFLHQNGICHGDFRPANILVKLMNLDHFDEGEMVCTESDSGLPVSAPKYLVAPADLSNLDSKFMLDEICVIDFGASFPVSSPPPDLGIPENYLAPEMTFSGNTENESDAVNEGDSGNERGAQDHTSTVEDKDCNVIGPACDVWALDCTLFEMRLQLPLFYMINDLDELIAEKVSFFGKLPERWWDKWEARKNYLIEDGHRLPLAGALAKFEPPSLKQSLSHGLKVLSDKRGNDGKRIVAKTFSVPEGEQGILEDLLRGL